GIGVVLGWALGGGASAYVAGLLVACGAVLAVRRGGRSARRGRLPERPARRLGPAVEAASSVVALLPTYVVPVLLVAMGVGMYRLELHEAGAGRQLERVVPWFGESTRWEGAFDGATFRATHPVHARLTLVAHTEVPTGRLVVNGTARPAPGKRNPGGFDYAAHLQRRGVAGQLFVDDVLNATPIVSVRERLRRGVAAGLPPDLAA